VGPTFTFTTRDGRAGLVRVARPRDARACLAIVTEAVRERPRTLAVVEDELWSPRVWRRHRIDWSARGVSLVAEIEGRVVGQLTCERAPRTVTRHGAEFGITIARAARGIGVGRALLDALEAWARAHGVTRIALGVFAGNERAITLYRSCGYTEEGVERRGVRFPEGDVDVIRMSKFLDARQPSQATADYDAETRPRGADGA